MIFEKENNDIRHVPQSFFPKYNVKGLMAIFTISCKD